MFRLTSLLAVNLSGHLRRSLATQVAKSASGAGRDNILRSFKSPLEPRKDIYQLPVNDEEVSRLNNQHVLLKMLTGGNCTKSVREHLSHEVGKEKAILDLGCGTGAWAMDMASEYPHCFVVGSDIAPMDLGLAPQNLRIDVCDANQGLEVYRNQFDLINGRLIAMGIKNYSQLISDIVRALKKGGFLQLQEWDFLAVDGEKRIIGPDRWFGRWCATLRHSLTARSASVTAAKELDDMVRAHGFKSVYQRDVWLPVGPSFPHNTPEGRHLNFVGELMRENIKAFIKGGKTLILRSGMKLEEYQTLEFNATIEVQDTRFPMYLRLNCVTAERH